MPETLGDIGSTGLQQSQHPKEGAVGGVAPGTSSLDLYNAMVLAEQEQGLGGNDDDDDDKDADSVGSLLSIFARIGDSNMENSGHQKVRFLKCKSCSGVLPANHGDANDEQQYCLPDGNKNQQNDDDEVDEDPSICSGASRVSI